MANTYCTATNFGKGFFTHEDRNDFYLSGHPGDVWAVGNNAAGVSWINRVSGTAKVKADAQAIVDGKIDEAIVSYDALSAEEQAEHSRPVKYTLPQDLTMATYKGIKGYNIPSVASDPSPLQTGQVWYNTTSATMKAYGASVSAGAWAAGATMNQIRYNSMAAGATSATALSFGGKYPSSPVGPTLDITESYNGSAWTELADLNTKKEDGYGFGSQTAAICASGYPGSPANTCEKWDGTSWSEVNNTNTSKGTGSESGTSSTAGLIAGGVTTTVLNETETWDGTSWTEVANLNTARQQNAGAAYAPSTDTLTFGGETPPYTAVTESWNGTSWTEVADLNTARTNGGGAGTSSTDAISFGGWITAAQVNNEAWNGTSWTEVGNLATAKTGAAASGTTSSAMYAGGQQPSGTPIYTAESQVWTIGEAIKTFTAT